MSVPLQIVSFPDKTQFTSNNINISENIYDPNDSKKTYNHIGTYKVSASSYFDNTKMAYNAFNGNKESYWKSNSSGNDYQFSNSTIPYTQTPYYSTNQINSLSKYQGGGNMAFNYYTTSVVNPSGPPTLLQGEWLQIELPGPMKLLKYSILTPPAQSSLHFFPLEFSIIGSQDGKLWYFIDQQVLSSPPDVSSRVPINFNLYNSNKYTYFRLVVTVLPHGCDNLRINQWNLYGIPPEKEGFIGLFNDQFSYYDISQPTLNNYSNFAISKPNYYQGSYNNTFNNGHHIKTNNIDEIIMSGILVFLLLGAIGYVSNRR
jgi:hypothetical protein